ASGLRASVSGGVFNLASGEEASVSGGAENTASGIKASISGGLKNSATGKFTSILGGKEGVEEAEFGHIPYHKSSPFQAVRPSPSGRRASCCSPQAVFRPEPALADTRLGLGGGK